MLYDPNFENLWFRKFLKWDKQKHLFIFDEVQQTL